MMFSSLRARLWLSFALLILLILCVFGAGVVLAWARNPPVVKLRLAEQGILTNIERNPSLTSPSAMEQTVRREALARGVRVIVLAPDGTTLADSRGLNQIQFALNFPTPLA